MGAAFLEAAGAPVAGPPGDARDLGAGPFACGVHLFKALPTGRGKCGCQRVKAILGSILRGTKEPVLEAFKAAGAALRLGFKAGGAAKPGLVVIAVLNYLQAPFPGITDTLLKTVNILVMRFDV